MARTSVVFDKEEDQFVSPKLPKEKIQAVKLPASIPIKPELKAKIVKEEISTKGGPASGGKKPAFRLAPEVPKEKKISSEKILPRFKRPIKKGIKRISDVKKDYKLVGAIDELSILDLKTFRRLDLTTKDQAEKVIKKIDLLGKDSLTKKTAGIQARRQSPLYRMYLAVGQTSMEHDMSIEQVINEYKEKGKDIITIEEFEAISDINRKLRF